MGYLLALLSGYRKISVMFCYSSSSQAPGKATWGIYFPHLPLGGRGDQIPPRAGTKFLWCFCAAVHLLPWWCHSPRDAAPHPQELHVPGEVPPPGIPHLLRQPSLEAAWGALTNPAKSQHLNPLLRPVLLQTVPPLSLFLLQQVWSSLGFGKRDS